MKVLLIHMFDRLRVHEENVVENEAELLTTLGIDTRLFVPMESRANFKKVFNIFFNYSTYLQVKQEIASFKPDVIHLHGVDFGSAVAVIRAAKKNKLPLVYTLHNYSLLCPSGTLFNKDKLFTELVHQDFSRTAIQKALYQNSRMLTFLMSLSIFLNRVLGTWNGISRLIVPGEHTKELLVKSKLHLQADRLIVKPDFTYPPKTAEPSTTLPPYYLYLGEFSDEKGLPVLLEAFADHHLPVKVAGSGRLKRLVYGYSEFYSNIILVDLRSKKEIHQLLQHATALIFPAVWYEIFGSVIIEAFSRGIPVIATARGGLNEMVKHGYNGLLFEAGNAKDLIAKIDFFEALTAEEKRDYCKSAFQTYLNTYTPEKNATDLINLYENVISEHKTSHTISTELF